MALETEKASLTGFRRNNRRLMRIHTFLRVFNPIPRQLYFPVKLLVTEKLERSGVKYIRRKI